MPLRKTAASQLEPIFRYLTVGALLAPVAFFLAGCGGGGTSTLPAITVSLSPSTVTVGAGATAQFSATVSSDSANKGVTWTVSCSTPPCGSVSPTATASGSATTYTAPGTAPVSNLTVTLTATSVTDATKSASATITVGASTALTVSVSPANTTVQPGMTAQLTATVKNDPANAGVTWAIWCVGALPGEPGMPCGTLSASTTPSGTAVTYTAPTAGDLNVSVVATSVTNNSVSASVSIRVPGIAVTVNPGSATVNLGSTGQFTATVINDANNQGVTWSLQETVNGGLVPCTSSAVCGTVSPASTASGQATTYSAPTTPPAGDFEVALTATSVSNNGASVQAFITIPGIMVSVDPGSATVEAGDTQQFTATVSNDASNSGVAWSLSVNGTACSPGCGTIKPSTTASGAPATYTAPATPPPSDLSVTVTAASVAQGAASGSATVTVPAIVVSIGPGSALLPLNTNQQFTATVSYDPSNGGVTWELTQGGAACSLGCGTVAPGSTASGTATTYTPPGTLPANPAVTLTATSVADTSKSAGAAINLTAGTVKIVPDTLSFGGHLVNRSSAPQSVVLTNTGNSTLSISAVTITGTDPNDFSQINDCGTSVAPAAQCTISVTFTPHAAGLRTAHVSIADNSVDSPQQVSLSGTGFTRRYGSISAVRAVVAGSGTVAAPPPSGPETVGTRVLDIVDRTRTDPYRGDSGKRQLLVRLWYPASLSQPCQPANYTSPKVWKYFSQLLGIALPEVVTNSCSDAPVKDGAHPLLIFTHGYTGTFTDYTFIFEDLASRGYVVASVDHTYEATAVAFPDGTLVKSVLGSHFDDSWRGDDRIMTFATTVRLQDLRFVHDELQRLNGKQGSFLTGKLDMSRVAIAGHSMGGAAAFLALQQDRRYKAGVILDSHLPPEYLRPTATPVLMLGASGGSWSEDQCQAWSSLRRGRLAVHFNGGEHVMFSDMVWMARGAIKTGAMSPEQTIAAVRDYIVAFLDANVRGRGTAPLLTGRSAVYPQAAVTTQKESLCAER